MSRLTANQEALMLHANQKGCIEVRDAVRLVTVPLHTNAYNYVRELLAQLEKKGLLKKKKADTYIVPNHSPTEKQGSLFQK